MKYGYRKKLNEYPKNFSDIYIKTFFNNNFYH